MYNKKIQVSVPVNSQMMKRYSDFSLSPGQYAERRVSMFQKTDSSITAAFVLTGDATDLHHHLPELFSRASALFRSRQLLTGGGYQLTQLHHKNAIHDI